MKIVTCYYDSTLPGQPWNIAIEAALAGLSPDERRKVQVICRPESMRKKSKGES